MEIETPRRPAAAPRLTRRGRAVVLLGLLALLLLAFGLGRASEADAGAGAPAPRRTVVVRPGDTLWTIARRAVPEADPRATIERIEALNGRMVAGALRPGQQLRVP